MVGAGGKSKSSVRNRGVFVVTRIVSGDGGLPRRSCTTINTGDDTEMSNSSLSVCAEVKCEKAVPELATTDILHQYL